MNQRRTVKGEWPLPQPLPWACPRCGRESVTSEAAPRCTRCGFQEVW